MGTSRELPACKMLRAVPAVEGLQGYSAPLEGRRGMLRLDFNENTIGPSPKVVEAIRAIPAEHYAIYPEYAGLAEKFAESVRCKPDQVACSMVPMRPSRRCSSRSHHLVTNCSP